MNNCATNQASPVQGEVPRRGGGVVRRGDYHSPAKSRTHVGQLPQTRELSFLRSKNDGRVVARPRRLPLEGSEAEGAVVNDSPVDCQSRDLTEPAGETAVAAGD